MGRKRKTESATDQLTDKEMAFAVEYSKDWNKKQAAIRAGYSEDCAAEVGFELANKPHVAKKVRAIQRDRAKRVEIDADWAIEQFVELYAEAREAKDRKSALKALESLGKVTGIYLKDNEQKHGIKSEAEADALRDKLRQRGFNLDAVNAPSSN